MWQDGRIIGLFVVFGVLFILFFAIQLYMRDKATLPPRILCRRNIWGSALFSFCLNSAMFIFVYYVRCTPAPASEASAQGIHTLSSSQSGFKLSRASRLQHRAL